jgi:hypothetical protein
MRRKERIGNSRSQISKKKKFHIPCFPVYLARINIYIEAMSSKGSFGNAVAAVFPKNLNFFFAKI